MRSLGISAAVLVAAMTLTPLGQAARASGAKPVIKSIMDRNTILPPSARSSAPIPLAVRRYMNPPTLLEGLALIDPVTCTEEAVGAWTSTDTQNCGTEKCGVVTTGTVTSTVGSGVRAGSTFTFATIYYEWTAHNNQSTFPAPPMSVADTFSATWAAPDGSTEQFTVIISVPVVRPDHETTAFNSWFGPNGWWQQTLVPPSSDPNFNFSGEIVQEFPAGQAGPDMCYVDGLGTRPFNNVTNDPADPRMLWHVEPGNTYSFDEVGYGYRNVCRYRNFSPTLKKFGVCGTRFGQQMGIHAPSDGPPLNPPTTYTPYGSTNTGDLNELGASMTEHFLTSIRAGMFAAEPFATGPVCP